MRKSLRVAASLIVAVSPVTAKTPENADPEVWATVQVQLEAHDEGSQAKVVRDEPIHRAKLLPEGDLTGKDSNFGMAVAVDGDTLVVGARDDKYGAESGVVYIFQRDLGDADGWSQVTKLMAEVSGGHPSFGTSVAINGDTVVVGAHRDWDNGSQSGSAYIFDRNQGGADHWGRVAKLLPSDGGTHDHFGTSVSISDDVVVVGASEDDHKGAVYIFGRDHGGSDSWGQITKITALDGANGDRFGRAVSFDGDTLVVGNPEGFGNSSECGSAYVFRHDRSDENSWIQVAKLLAADGESGDAFGWSVSVAGDTVVVGAIGDDDIGFSAGSAYIFDWGHNGEDGWGQAAKLNAKDGAEGDEFGYSVSVFGGTVVVGCPRYFNSGHGSGYVYSRRQGGYDQWGLTIKLSASDGSPGDIFGLAVCISGETIAVGAPFDDDFGDDSGSTYCLRRNDGAVDNWVLESKVVASGWSSAEGDWFGASVSISGDVAVVGARYDDDATENSGSAYVFARDLGAPEAWGLMKQLKAWDGAPDDGFGAAVSISGDVIVVGAPYDDDNGYSSGSAYIFGRNEGGIDTWGLVAKISPSDGAPGDVFGFDVCLDGDTVIIAAVGNDDNGDGAGAAYVFVRNLGGLDVWGQLTKLMASDGAEGDHFGGAVALSGDTVVVGARTDDDNGRNSGSAYVFDRNHRGTNRWGQIAKLTASDGEIGDSFGTAVSVSGDTAIIGAYLDDGDESNCGSAYIFGRDHGGPNAWGEVTGIVASVGTENGNFGTSVSISGDTVVVGADTEDTWLSSGSSYVFQRNNGGSNMWNEVARLTNPPEDPTNLFGCSVANSGDTIVIGSPGDFDLGHNSGSALIFEISRNLEVQRVGTTPDTGDGVLSYEEWAVVEITGLSILFSKSMLDPAGDTDPGDVTNPSNWLLVGAGPDDIIQTTACVSGAEGDDVPLVPDTFAYDEAELTVVFRPNGGTPLPNGAYSLFACGTLESIGGLLMDGNGDGIGGDDYVLPFAVDSTLPSNPTLFSPSHSPGVWSTNATIEFSWSGAADEPSGIAGYSVILDSSSETVPDDAVDVPHTSDPHTVFWDSPDGDSVYFHLRTCDVAGNCSSALHLGPFRIDATGPTSVTGLISTSHSLDSPTNDPTIDVQWTAPTDEYHGVEGYGVHFSMSSVWTCDQMQDTTETSFSSPPLGDGPWRVFVCAVDGLGNWSGVTSAGPFVIDTIPPTIDFIWSEGHTINSYLGDGENVLEAVTQLMLRFSEPMFNPEGNTSQGDLTNPLYYRVVDLGSDGILSTEHCTSVLGGDDGEIPPGWGPVGWDNTDRVVSITDLGTRGLPRGRYSLMVCGVKDPAGHKLVGPWTQSFTISATNLLMDPNFEDDGLNVWDLESPNGNEIFWNDQDHTTDTSGVLSIDSRGVGTGQTYELSQCLDVGGDAPFVLGAQTWIFGLTHSPILKAVVRYFRNAGCTDSLETHETIIAQGHTNGTWIQLPLLSSRSPSDALSARVGFVVEGDTASNFLVTLDEVAFFEDTFFVDGFETRDTSAWH